MNESKSLTGSQTATAGSDIRITVEFVHHLSIPKKDLRVAKLHIVDTSTELGILDLCDSRPVVAELANVPLSAIDVEWFVAEHSLCGNAIVNLDFEVGTCNVATSILAAVVVLPEESRRQLNVS